MGASVLWKAKLGFRFAGSFIFLVGTRVVCLVEGSAGPALTAWTTDGKHAWSLAFTHALSGFPFGDDVYVDGSEVTRVRGLDGEVLTRRDFGEDVQAYLPPADGPVFRSGTMAQPKALFGLDPTTLETRWEVHEHIGRSRVHDRTICSYLPQTGELRTTAIPELQVRAVHAPFEPEDGPGTHAHAAGLWCHFFRQHRYGVDLATGALIWRQNESESGHHGVQITAFNDRLYSWNRTASCFAGDTGELIWRQGVGGMQTSTFQVTPDGVWAVMRGGDVYRLSLEDGRVLGHLEMEDEALGIVPIGHGRAVLATYEHIMSVQL